MGQAEARRWTQTARPLFRVFTAVLAVGHGTRPRVGTCGVRQEHVAAEAKALVATVCIHASVLARPGFESTLIHILAAAFPGVSWKASTFVWSHTLTKLASRFTQSFTDSLAAPSPAIAAGQYGSIATDTRLEQRCRQRVIPWTGCLPYSTCHPEE